MSVELSISKKNIDCIEVANFLTKCGVRNANIIGGTGIVNGLIEPSCTIRLGHDYSSSNKFLINQLWTNLKSKYNFECAYFSVPGIYGGCIKDWMRPSNCIGKI
jgi:hypothetical protein